MTNETNNGQTESKTAKDQLAELDTILDEYVNRVGVRLVVDHSEADEFMSMSRADMKRLSPEDCGEGAYLLSRMAGYIQEQLNKDLARVEWAERKISFIANVSARQYGNNQYEERKMAAIRENEFTRKLYAIATYAKQRSIRLSYLPARLESMAQRLDNLQYSKRKGMR